MTDRIASVIGASGFIGAALASELRRRGRNVRAVGRDERYDSSDLGDVFYCAGITADFRTQPAATIDSHAGTIARLMESCTFTSLLYLSTTRVYIHSARTVEDGPIVVDPANPDDLYGISKLLGESVCLRDPREGIRVVRLSNVLGQNGRSVDFVYSLLRAARHDRHVVLQTSLDSAKDYVSLADAVDALLKIASGGSRRIYNVASGTNTTNREVVEAIAAATGATYEVVSGAKTVRFPEIDVSALREEFAWNPQPASRCIEILANSWVDEMEQERA